MDRKIRFVLKATKHKLLDLNMRLVQLLVCALIGVLREIMAQRLFDVARQCLMPLDQVRVVTIHLPYKSRRAVSHDWGRNLGGESASFTEDVATELGQDSFPCGRQERLHGRGMCIKLFFVG